MGEAGGGVPLLAKKNFSTHRAFPSLRLAPK